MSRNFGKVWNCVSTVLVALVVLLAALLAGARLFGLQVFTILSGSMEPKYPVGSLIYVKSVDPLQVKEGDVIAEVGETGVATGPHLHFELHEGSQYLNPIYYVSLA